MANHTNGYALARARYVPRLRVTAADLTADQDYVRERLRRHNRLLHGCGVICGLLVDLPSPETPNPEQEQEQAQRIRIASGNALTAQGDEVEVPEAVTLAPSDFCFMVGGNAATRVRASWPPPGQDPCPGGLEDQVYYLGLCYRETQSHPRSVLDGNCYENTVCENTRLHDNFEFVLLDSVDPAADCVWIDLNREDQDWMQRVTTVPGTGGATVTALQFTRRIYFPAGRYRFTTTLGQRARLFIDNTKYVDRWVEIEAPNTADVLLGPGKHSVVVEFLGDTANPNAHLFWEVLESGWLGEYFSFPTSNDPPTMPPSSAAALVRIDPGIGFFWEAGAPGGGVSADHFIARWTRDINICSPGEYEFIATTDDGMRIYIDDQIILDSWIAQSTTTYRPHAMLSTGMHRVRVEFYERRGGAIAHLNWVQVGPYNPPCVTPAAGGCVILAALTVNAGQVERVDNYEFNADLGHFRKLLPSAEMLAEQVACLNRNEARPAITQIVPGSGARGTNLRAMIFGNRLGGATHMTFAGEGVTGMILPGGTDSWLPIEITIASTAALGQRSFSIAVPGGVIDSTSYRVTFIVTGGPVVATQPPTLTFTFQPPTLEPPFTFTVDPGGTFTFRPPVTLDPLTRDPFTRPGGGVIDPGEVFINPGGGVVINPGAIGGRIPGGRIPGGGGIGGNVGRIITNNEIPGGGVMNRRPTLGDLGESEGLGDFQGLAFSAPADSETHPVDEVRGIGQTFATRLQERNITTAEQVASIEPALLASILSISEVRAMALVDAARDLLRSPGE